jgi:hypothetical protein
MKTITLKIPTPSGVTALVRKAKAKMRDAAEMRAARKAFLDQQARELLKRQGGGE